MLGISIDLLRKRIKIGKYPAPLRNTGNHRLFTDEHVNSFGDCANPMPAPTSATNGEGASLRHS
jgi:hypothetical protein